MMWPRPKKILIKQRFTEQPNLAEFYNNLGYDATDEVFKPDPPTLSVYRLVVWLFPISDPVWINDVLDGEWQGRLCVVVRSVEPASIAYINTRLSGAMGMSLGTALVSTPVVPAEVHALTAGQATFAILNNNEVFGGEVLCKRDSGAPILAHNKPTNTSYVLSGNSHLASTGFIGFPAPTGDTFRSHNARFLENLISVEP